MFYTYEWKEEGQWIADLDFDVEHEVSDENEVIITGLYLGTINSLESNSPHLKAIAERAKNEVLQDEDWCAARIREADDRARGQAILERIG